MKTQRLSVGLLVVFAAASTSHTRTAQALTYEEVTCMAQALANANDPMQCVSWGSGGGGGGAGSGGSGSGGGDGSGSADGGGPIFFPPTPSKCAVPTFFFTGPPDPTTVSFSVAYSPPRVFPARTVPSQTKDVLTFVESVGGKPYQFQRQITTTIGTDGSGDFVHTFEWTATQYGISGPVGTPQYETCTE
jgi:hypothetical protein